jgi:spore coat protein U-like protein
MRTFLRLALLAAFSAAWPAHAGVGTSSVTATVTVATNCAITTTPVAFGTYDPIGTNATTPIYASGSVTVTCVKNTAPVIAMSLGNYANGSQRRMSNGSDYLAYELYQPPNNTPNSPCSFPATTVWGSNGNAFAATVATDKGARAYSVCGAVSAGQNPSVGTYTDTVVATVTF